MRGSRGAACPPDPWGSCSTQRGGLGRGAGAEPPGPQRPPPVPGPTWRELGRSKRRERSSTRPVAVLRGAWGAPLALPPRPVSGATGAEAEAAMVPSTPLSGASAGHCSSPVMALHKYLSGPRWRDSPLSPPAPPSPPSWGLPTPLWGIHGAPMTYPVPGHHPLPPATAPSRVPRGQLRSAAE